MNATTDLTQLVRSCWNQVLWLKRKKLFNAGEKKFYSIAMYKSVLNISFSALHKNMDQRVLSRLMPQILEFSVSVLPLRVSVSPESAILSVNTSVLTKVEPENLSSILSANCILLESLSGTIWDSIPLSRGQLTNATGLPVLLMS